MNNNMNNTTYGEEGALSCGYPSVSLLQQTIRAGIVLLVLICSLVGNIFVLRVVRKNIKLHSVTHYLIVNLAVADLLITVFNMTELLKIEVTGSEQTFGGVAGDVYCIGSIVIFNLSVAPFSLCRRFQLRDFARSYFRSKESLHSHVQKGCW